VPMLRERGWTVSVTSTAVSDGVRTDLDAQVDELVDRLAAYRAVASTSDGRRYTVTLAIPGPADAAGAVAVAVGAVRGAADEIGLGRWSIVHTEAGPGTNTTSSSATTTRPSPACRRSGSCSASRSTTSGRCAHTSGSPNRSRC